jgi:HEAT repeat protein
MSRLKVFEVVKYAMCHCGILSRRAASAALAEFKGGEANELALQAMDDTDPEVQANVVRQMRDRGIPGIMPRLIELVESPHERVREAARQSLSEFNFQRFISAFEMLEPEIRRCSGTLVKRVDPQAVEQLKNELMSPMRTKRLRGIEVAIAMEAVPDVEELILQLAQDPDHFIRVEAAQALVHVHSEKARSVLYELLLDRSVSVQEAAQQALLWLGINPVPAGDGPIAIPTVNLPVQSVTPTPEPTP